MRLMMRSRPMAVLNIRRVIVFPDEIDRIFLESLSGFKHTHLENTNIDIAQCYKQARFSVFRDLAPMTPLTMNNKPPLSIPEIGPIRVLMESVQDMRLVIKDLESRYLYVNPCWLQENGLESLADVVGKTASEVFPKWQAARYLREEQRVIEEGHVYDYQEFLLNSDGEIERWRTIKAPWMEGGTLRGYVNIGTRLGATDLENRSDQIPQIVQTIAKQACQALSFDDLAASAGISRRTLERRFKAIMDETPQEFRTKCRMIQAKKLLRQGKTSIVVSEACGFFDQSHFTKSFTQQMDITPKQYQLQERKRTKKNKK